MVTAPISFDHVWKRYTRTSHHDSLRDAISSLLARWVGRNGHERHSDAFWALRDVSFRVAAGETLGIVGPNGAGKSTILKLLSKITKETYGTVRVHGHLAALIELGSGFHPDLSGAENIYLQGAMLGLPHRRITRLYEAIVAFSELGAFLETPVKRYSSGMIVRLGFAIAAQVKPHVLLIDEVLAVGDLAFQQKCFKTIAELKRAGTTMIFISHNLEAVQKLCDRVALLREGHIVAEGDPVAMIARYREDVLTRSLRPSLTASARDGGPLRIDGIVLRNGEGERADSLETGDPLQIELRYSTARAVKEPTFQVTIERLDGLVCHTTSSRQGGLTPALVQGDGTVTLEYRAVILLPNLYQVRVDVFEGSNPIPLTSVHQRCFFQVTSDRPEQGAIHLDHTWGVA